MIENDPCETAELHPPSSSTSEVTDNETEKIEGNNFELFEAAYESILDELVDDAMWELCFEVHRAAKLGYFFLEDPEKRKYQIVEDAEKDIFGQKLKSKVPTFQISCPICKNKSCATKFASHLAKCIGISGSSRTSSRAANKKIAAASIFSSDLDENDYESDSSFNANRKKSKKSQSKKHSRKKPKVQGNSLSKSSSETNANYQEMTYEKRKAFFNQKCGVISKRTNKMCMNPHKCSQHTDEQRRDVRHSLLRDMGDQLTNDGQIDVDTVDEGNDGFSFIPQPLPAYCASDKNIPSTAGFSHEKKHATSSKNNSGNFRKKKTGYDSSNLVSNTGQIMPTGSSFESI